MTGDCRVRGGAARFDFHELCDRPLGAADYLALSQARIAAARFCLPLTHRASYITYFLQVWCRS